MEDASAAVDGAADGVQIQDICLVDAELDWWGGEGKEVRSVRAGEGGDVDGGVAVVNKGPDQP